MFEKFRFRKFSPSEDFVIDANTMLSQVMDIAPDNSNCYASITKLGDTYTAWIEITAPEENFTAEARAEEPRLAVDILDERIRNKIKKWQSSRKFPENTESWNWPPYEGTYGIFPKNMRGGSSAAS